MLHRIQSSSSLLWSMPALQKDLGALTPWAGLKREIESTDRILLAHIDAHRKGKGSSTTSSRCSSGPSTTTARRSTIAPSAIS
jgi:hypothetical protein